MQESQEEYRPKIGIVGAGFSGMCAGIKLQKELNIHDYTIFDENGDVGGTWLTHTYPGCACDIPSHVYSFSFEMNPNWSRTYASQPEILSYLKQVARKHDLYSKIKFNHHVIKSTWDEKINKWRVQVQNKETEQTTEFVFDLLISAVGGLRVPNIPEQFKGFEGPSMHSARWNHDLSLENKTVAVIGSGCSAVQIIPEIAPKVKKLKSFQRHPAWITPQSLFHVPSVVKRLLTIFPFLLWLLRTFLFLTYEVRFPLFKAKSKLRGGAKWLLGKLMVYHIPNSPELREKLTPNYELGCKRVSPSNRFYKALDLPQCEVVREGIAKVKKNSIVTKDGKEHHIDVLILCTGYRVQEFFAPLEVIGVNGEVLLDTWKKQGPSHYLGIVSNSAPNSFFLLGPNTAYGHNSVIFAIECQANWTIQVIGEFIKSRSRIVRIKKSAETRFMEDLRKRLQNTVWEAYDCGSWYANHLGKNTTLYPGSLFTYWNETRTPIHDDLEFY